MSSGNVTIATIVPRPAKDCRVLGVRIMLENTRSKRGAGYLHQPITVNATGNGRLIDRRHLDRAD